MSLAKEMRELAESHSLAKRSLADHIELIKSEAAKGNFYTHTTWGSDDHTGVHEYVCSRLNEEGFFAYIEGLKLKVYWT